jgi:FKBP-type peptidyl-prolyl cis-trans isomerase SlyD
MEDKQKVEDGQVVGIEYTLHVDGELVDQNEEDEPLEFIQGTGDVIGGLEQALYGMVVGESKKVVVSAENGYGDRDLEAFVEVPRDQFPDEIPMEVGVELQVKNDEGDELMARIDTITKDTVKLDFNHPLAGKELHFDVKIASLRPATEEELDHGHVHDGFEDEDDEDYEEYEDDDDEVEEDEQDEQSKR